MSAKRCDTRRMSLSGLPDAFNPRDTRRRHALKALAAMAAGMVVPGHHEAFAQAWPTRPIKIVVPFAPGGTTDLIARLIAPSMAQTLGQPVIVDNRPGAGGLLGAEAVAKAPADGHTLLMANISLPLAVLAAQRLQRPGFDPEQELRGVGIVANVPMVITAPASSPARDLREFAAQVRTSRSEHFTYGSPGAGSYLHVFGEWLQQEIQAPLTHVPFKGTAPLKQEMLAGRIHLGGDQLSSSLGDIQAGKLRALAIAAPRRSPLLPSTPTLQEQGFGGIDIEGWNGLLAPAQTPARILTQLQQAVAQAAQAPQVRQRLQALGAEPVGSQGRELDALLHRQLAQFRPMVAGLALE